jgi:hypothetical protein
MRFLDTFKNALTKKPRSATEFVGKFIGDSKRQRVQLELIRESEIIIQVDSLRQTPSWFKIFDVDKAKFKNGFVIFFIIDQKDIEKNEKYILYKNSDLTLLEQNEMFEETPIRTFAKFIEETDDPVYLGREMKKILDKITSLNEKDPQALFNLRYLKEEKTV